MDSFQKYSRLMLLIAGGFLGLIAIVTILFFILRLFSVTFFHIPGFDLFFQFMIVVIPYVIVFAAYFYLFRKIRSSKSRASRAGAAIVLVAGTLLCMCALILAIMLFLKVSNEWLQAFDENSQYALIIHIIILLIAAGILASGNAKEKDWMERGAGL